VTNSRGVARFKYAFRSTGNVVLRASVVATDTFLQATSSSVVEAVDTQLPLVLPANTALAEGSTGSLVLLLQQRLNALGYWVGSPDGHFGDATQQATYALEKAAGIARSGVVNAAFVAALNAGTLPLPRTSTGNAIDINLSTDLLMIVQNGVLKYVLNTSTGGGYTYTEDGSTYVAITPSGVYSIGRAVNGIVVDSLGSLWRPRFFYEGFAIHGDSYVPPTPVSHGCVRISNEAIDWIWAQNLAPIGMKVWVY
jgi:peptidoglycan hydrolase-like protein with peptidoglycan-binding domain